MHFIARFGIGAVSLKAYKIAINAYGYNKLASYFGPLRFRSESLWNTAGDIIFGVLGGMTAYYIDETSF